MRRKCLSAVPFLLLAGCDAEPVWTAKGWTNYKAGIVLSVLSIAAAFGAYLLGAIPDWYARRRLRRRLKVGRVSYLGITALAIAATCVSWLFVVGAWVVAIAAIIGFVLGRRFSPPPEAEDAVAVLDATAGTTVGDSITGAAWADALLKKSERGDKLRKQEDQLRALEDAVRRHNDRTKEGATALHLAASMGGADVVAWLIGMGANVDARTADGLTALHAAAGVGNAEAVSVLVNAGASLEARGAAEIRPLHVAAANGRLECLAALLRAGADANARESRGITALHLSILRDERSVDAVKMLVDAGADPLLAGPNGQTALHLAARTGFASALQLLLGKGGGVDAQDTHGWTPLHHAVAAGQAEVEKILMDLGADLNSRDEEGRTPRQLKR